MLEWTQNLTPIHTGFSDKYYAEEGGLDETRYVYLGQNNLEERFKSCDIFVVSELGFGTGLNFLATLKLWKTCRHRPSQFLHYISTELFPLEPEAIQQALSPWVELREELSEFLKVYAPEIHLQNGSLSRRIPSAGIHRFNLSHGVFLTLLIGDATQSLAKMGFKADAWYLDGFSPRKNPQMWSSEIFQDVARLSKPQATFATFTVAGHVRRKLQEVGFEVQKFSGFGRKKEMLKGFLKGEASATASASKRQKSALIIGAGLAGTSTAYELSKRNWKVVLADRNATIASESSGNPWAVFYPLLTKIPSKLSQYSLQAYDYLLRSLHSTELGKDSHVRNLGVLQLKRSDKDFERYSKALEWIGAPPSMMKKLSSDQASEIAGIPIQEEAVYFPEAGSLKPSQFCSAMINQTNSIQILPATPIHASNLSWNDGLKLWELKASNELYQFDAIVLCNAYQAKDFDFAASLSLGRNRGQLCELKSTARSSKLRCIISGDFYMTPKDGETHLLGATYDRESSEPTLKMEDNLELLSRPQNLTDELKFEASDISFSRASMRTSTPTKLPFVGQLAGLQGPAYVNLGHGSRGLVYSPLSAQILADTMSDMPIACDLETIELLKPKSAR